MNWVETMSYGIILWRNDADVNTIIVLQNWAVGAIYELDFKGKDKDIRVQYCDLKRFPTVSYYGVMLLMLIQ